MTALLAAPRIRHAAGAFSPLSIPWYAAFYGDDITGLTDGAPVSSWTDSSGNSRPATQATSAKRPVYRPSVASLSSRPGVEFDGVDDVLTSLFGASLSSSRTVVVVFDTTTTANSALAYYVSGQGISNRLEVGQTSSAYFHSAGTAQTGGTVDGAPHYILACQVTGSEELTLDGSTLNTTAAGTQSSDRINMGTNSFGSTGFWAGYITFAAVIGRALTSTEKTAMLTWARSKYGTP